MTKKMCAAPVKADYKGCVGKPLMDADPDEWFIGAELHVHIGVVNFIFSHFEKDCRRIDGSSAHISMEPDVSKLEADKQGNLELLTELEDEAVTLAEKLADIQQHRDALRRERPGFDFSKTKSKVDSDGNDVVHLLTRDRDLEKDAARVDAESELNTQKHKETSELVKKKCKARLKQWMVI